MERTYVYMVRRIRTVEGRRETSVCGVFSSEQRAQLAVEQLRSQAHPFGGSDDFDWQRLELDRLERSTEHASWSPSSAAPPPWAHSPAPVPPAIATPPWGASSEDLEELDVPVAGSPSPSRSIPPRPTESVALQRRLIEEDPWAIEPYQALFRLYREQGAQDHAWMVAAALVFLGHADDEARRLFGADRAKGGLSSRARLTPQMWSEHLRHPDEDPTVSQVMEHIAPAALQAKHHQLRVQRKLPVLDARFKQDPERSTVTFARTFGAVAGALGIAAPELYVRPDVPGTIVAVPALPPASIAGQTVLTGLELPAIAFVCGQHLTYYRPEYYVRTLFPTCGELITVFLTGVYLGAPSTPLPPDIEEQIRATARELAKYTQPIQLEGLRLLAKRFLAGGGRADIQRWMHCAELTACRAGLLMCGDLQVARDMHSVQQQLPNDVSPKAKMGELLKFSISAECLALRRALGTSIPPSG